MNSICNQKGASIIAVIAIMLILAVMGAALISLVTTGSDVSVNQLQSEQTLYIAEGGMERALYRLKTGTLCSSLTENNVPLGQGNFDITGTNYTLSNTLSANIIAGDTTIPLTSTAGFATVGRIMIESEIIDYYGISGNNLTNALRGVAGTTAVAHLSGISVAKDQCRIVSTGEISGGLLTTATRVVERSMQNPGAMIVYAKAAADNIPYYRRWDGTQWGPERQATAVGAGNTIQYLVLKFARTRNEAILGTLDSSGEISVQVWNGNTNTWSATTLLADAGTASDVGYRSFDIEYETSGDRAIVVFKDANGSANPDYRIWDGTSWSAATNIIIATTGEVRWIELAPNPLTTSNEIVMITLDTSNDVYGMRWTGTVWSDMGVAGTWDTSAANSGQPANTPSKIIDVAYEQLNGRAMFIWGDTTATDNYYRIWDGTTLSAANILLDIPAMGDEADWVRLVPRPNSNELMYGVQDGGRDLNTRLWNGVAWDTAVQHPEHDATTEDVDDRNFDIVFETDPANAGKAWLLWGNGTVVSRKQWDSGTNSWGATATTGDNTALVQLAAHPRSGVIFAGIYEDSASTPDDIWEMHLTGGAWTAQFTIWSGPTVADPVMERVFIGVERYIPNIFWREVF